MHEALIADWFCFALENCPGEEPCLTWFSQWGEAAFHSGFLISIFPLDISSMWTSRKPRMTLVWLWGFSRPVFLNCSGDRIPHGMNSGQCRCSASVPRLGLRNLCFSARVILMLIVYVIHRDLRYLQDSIDEEIEVPVRKRACPNLHWTLTSGDVATMFLMAHRDKPLLGFGKIVKVNIWEWRVGGALWSSVHSLTWRLIPLLSYAQLSAKMEVLCMTSHPSKQVKWDVKWCFQETEFKGEVRFGN